MNFKITKGKKRKPIKIDKWLTGIKKCLKKEKSAKGMISKLFQ